ncbi:MAG: hypothetical protein JWQ28_1630, partial [Pedobacter sp.]|nr:hypothetical protein [Pedobacter sp.]
MQWLLSLRKPTTLPCFRIILPTFCFFLTYNGRIIAEFSRKPSMQEPKKPLIYSTEQDNIIADIAPAMIWMSNVDNQF